jgi:DNA-binding NarL/FixJ family response regulator
MIRVLIADGQAEVRWGLRMRLAIESDIAIVGEAGDVEKALSLAQALRPDVIVVDIGMRGADGVNLIRQLRAAAPAAAVVVLTLHDDQDSRRPDRGHQPACTMPACGDRRRPVGKATGERRLNLEQESG